ncbi:MAG: hypothetical protein JXR91_08840 [Deltaproteobacteria bacterium]|nr:hypothetical protein [Deltaproteobacteria bacterium]
MPLSAAYFGRIAAILLFCAGSGIFILSSRLMLESKEQFYKGEEFLKSGNIDLAINAFEDSARAYVPGNIYCVKSLKRLSIMAKSSIIRGDINEGVYIFEVIRRSILSTRNIVLPNKKQIEEAETFIKEYSSDSGPDSLMAKAERVVRPADPSYIIVILLFAGLLLWMAGVAGFILLKVTKYRIISGSAGFLGFVLWISMSYVV